ncbi:cytochrome P450 [Amycolatopsis minnesotensis]|uniref:Cytochrome P450 n=1 Tax=Amycolatopsis minnesotensis TaxID=337894 RepID=A0ABP5DZM7_9PSEU
MTDAMAGEVPELDLADPEVLADPLAAYGCAHAKGPMMRLGVPGLGPLWAATRQDEARAVLGDPRFAINSGSFLRHPAIPDECLVHLRTMSELDGPEHRRIRRLVAPAFTPRRAEEFRPRVERIVAALLDGLPAEGPVDLLDAFARPLPMDVICELVGIPEIDRPRWREYGAAVLAGAGDAFGEAVPGIIDGAKAAVERRRAAPGDDLLDDLIRAQAEDGDRLSDVELVTLVWQLVLAGQTPANLIANGLEVLLTHRGELEKLRADPSLMPTAVDELIRLCGPNMLAIPRYAREDAEVSGTQIREGDRVTAVIASANRDPRAFEDPDRLDITRPPRQHLGFGYGPHVCLGASLARVQTEVALAALLDRFPNLSLAENPENPENPENLWRATDPGTLRLAELPVVY